MLLNSFFFIDKIEIADEQIRASLRIEKDHSIFVGHFPGQPVVPGVCMIQMVKEILEQNLKVKLLMSEANNIKFLSVIDPTIHHLIDAFISIEENENELVKVNAVLSRPATVFFKMKATFKVI